MIKSDLNIAGLEIDERKSNERMIWIKKDSANQTKGEHGQKEGQAEKNNFVSEIKKILFAMDKFRKLVVEKKSDSIIFDDFQMNLTSSGKFYE